MFSHPPHVTPLVVEAELEVPETVDRCLSGNRTDDCANLIFQSDVLVAGSLRDKTRTFQIKRPELVGHDRLVRVLQRLKKIKQMVNFARWRMWKEIRTLI